jgi:hypothetical protein
MTLRCGFRRRRGDVAEVDALYVTVGPRPLCCSRAMGGGDAEDVASQGWLQLVRDLPAVRESRGFRGWPAAIARHWAVGRLRHYRRRRAVPTAMDELMELPAQYPYAGDDAVESVSTDTGLMLIASLLPDQAEARYCCGWSCAWASTPRPRCWVSDLARSGSRPTVVCVAWPPNSASNQNVPVDHS